MTLMAILCSAQICKYSSRNVLQQLCNVACCIFFLNRNSNEVAYLTEEKGEGVFAADVWPKMELEVFPKSGCPPEPPNMLPVRVEVPKPPLL